MDFGLYPEQDEFAQLVLSGYEQYHLLLGGAGTGKTTVTSKLMCHYAMEGKYVISLYPTHAAKYIAIEKVREEVEKISFEEPESNSGLMDEDDCIIVLPDRSIIDFRTIHSMLGMRMIRRNGRTQWTAKQEKDQFDAAVSKLGGVCRHFDNLMVFVDEVSMITRPFLTTQRVEGEKYRRHPNVKGGGLTQILDESKLRYRIIFTGDFNQLKPVKAPVKEFAESFMKHHVETFTLKVNRRSESIEIVKLAEFAFNNGGRLPKDAHHSSIRRFKNHRDFTNLYLDYLKEGKDAVVIVRTNERRKFYENLAASTLYGEPNPIFLGNIVLCGKTKTKYDPCTGTSTTILYSQERVIIKSKEDDVIIGNTKWSNNPVTVTPVKVQRLTNLSYLNYYAVMSIGENMCPDFAEYVKEVKQAYGEMEKMWSGKIHAPCTLECLARYMFDFNPNLEPIFLEHWDMFENGSKNKPYFNQYWINVEKKWSPGLAILNVADLIWARYFKSIEELILPLKTTVAQTCHTAQGSGREYVFVDRKDIKKARTEDDRRRLTYVACSRAEKELIILG